MTPTRLLHRLTLVIALLIGGAFLVPEPVEASPNAAQTTSCKKKRKKTRRAHRKARRAKRRRRRDAKARRIGARTIKRWQKRGWSDEKIVEKARKRGYKVTKRERRRLRRYRVRKSLRIALAAPPKPKKTGPQPIDIHTTIDPNDIDFDSVPPPQGMDMRYADAHRQEAERGK